jgi:hypothetical protein
MINSHGTGINIRRATLNHPKLKKGINKMKKKFKTHKGRLLTRHDQRVKLMQSVERVGFYCSLMEWGESNERVSAEEEGEVIYDLDSISKKIRPLTKIVRSNVNLDIRPYDLLDGVASTQYSEFFKIIEVLSKSSKGDNKTELYERIVYKPSDFSFQIPGLEDEVDRHTKKIVSIFEKELNKQALAHDFTLEIYGDPLFKLKINGMINIKEYEPLIISRDLAFDFLSDAVETFTSDCHSVYKMLLLKHYYLKYSEWTHEVEF